MTRQTRTPQGVSRQRPVPQTRQDDEAAAQAEQLRERLRADRDRLLDSVLDEPVGETELIGARSDRPELCDRARADEEYVKTFKQEGGE